MRHLLTMSRLLVFLSLLGLTTQAQTLPQEAPLWHTWTAALHAQIARFYSQQERHDEALAHLNQALRLLPESVALHIQRGQTYLLLYEWDAALADFNAAIDRDPSYAPAYFQRGLLYYTRAEREAARDDFQRFLALAPQAEEVSLARTWLAAIEGELEALNSP
ncbi:MAG: tetratricopeptide repeat protein [Anaerolineae bacterium]|nr:tetratricopeptide repeat protein [Anaerolineae bacterium]MDW8171508.1 tetratricopeptide repeat protein [Anaerolineae bacterium]